MTLPIKDKHSLRLLIVILSFIFVQHHYDLAALCLHNVISKAAHDRRKKVRIRWSEVNERISDKQFRKMFRMTRDCFKKLCERIIKNIGERNFKSQAYIDNVLDVPIDYAINRMETSMYQAHSKTSSGYISGEIKLAITIRMLAGGDPYDLGVLFDISDKWCRQMFTYVLKNWIVDINLGEMDITSYLTDEKELDRVSKGFSKRSNGVLIGAIGAIDGWLVKIKRPSITKDNIKNIVGFFSRKGFYALNVQCIVNHEKKVLWAKCNNRGSSHDSSSFRDSNLYNYLKSKSDTLFQHGYFILGDSAYAVESFILPPYDQPKKESPEDNYNFYHSSARITVECAFGEIDLRWGILWKRLGFSLDNNMLIIEAALHLHNYIVAYRNEANLTQEDYNYERRLYIDEVNDSGLFNNIVTNDNFLGDGGRPNNEERQRRINGIALRDKLRESIKENKMVRRRKNDDIRCDVSNHILQS